jgi:uncharacterized membrane protein
MPPTAPTGATARKVGQVALGAALLLAGTGHLTAQREEFQAQVPTWFPVDPDTVVVATWKQPARALVGGIVGAFFVAVFPGNIAQFTGHVDAFGLDTDTKRAVRLLFQPVLVAWALASTDALGVLRARRRRTGNPVSAAGRAD